MKKPLLVLAVLLLGVSALAQQSTNFKIEEHAFNAGGHPAGGVILASTSYRITLDSIGDSVSGTAMGSASYNIEGGFSASFPPPGEVHGLRFHPGQLAQWEPERSVGTYTLYGGSTSGLIVSDYGSCLLEDLTSTSTVVSDSVTAGDTHFYLVTAKNRLGEEGTPGFDSHDTERPDGTPCP